jgi:hypothetical protein
MEKKKTKAKVCECCGCDCKKCLKGKCCCDACQKAKKK